ncbi:selenocysteine-specific translation elongation factor [Fusobacterium ulcerans]|uniref:Selenocysteine-specific elongation factor n=1 Tax=Fusobacterium ulcerans TaxID=861 RepID=A0AAX2JBA5_9FUSO|nr:selenocysteine-specific translation elongation factor [Fusobacterium ulcerans]AVQ28565.1 selenocysteine-specific translation elongation factor [Fusobacterium ulcerans]EFS26035.1 selenocysteine-specific translation elongation factor [Fusobacterium ulcerans ATCC 49185]SQJ00450.1 SelB translation factor [Fusobacterium ulcerans]
MRNIIIGTAGHIDHGKTTIVKGLTGKDTDTLPEEKARGMTIDLGFTFFTLSNGRKVGIVDVPGHEKFIKNMAAGVTGIDLILFVIACDDGIKPQTLEHADIIKILGVKKGLILLTKRDLADEERAAQLKEDVRELFKNSYLENSKILEISTKDAQSFEKLKEVLEKEILEIEENRDEIKDFRLDIDKVFSIKGFGTVVTGTSKNSKISIGDTVMIYPQQKEVKIKGIENHGNKVETLEAGNRCALNINMDSKEIKRGNIISKKDSLIISNRLDCVFTLLKRSSNFKNNQRVRINIGTEELIGRVKIFLEDEILSGDKKYVQIDLEKESAFSVGDIGIVRSFSPVETIGGVEIINIPKERVKRKDLKYLERLEILSSKNKYKKIESIVLNNENIFTDKESISLLLGEKISEKEMENSQNIEKISDNIYVNTERLENFKNKILEYIEQYHEKYPLSVGIKRSELKNRFFENFSIKVYNIALEYFIEKNTIEVLGEYISKKDFKIKLNKEQKKIKEDIFSYYKKNGFTPQKIEDTVKIFKDETLFAEIHSYMLYNSFLAELAEGNFMLKGFFLESEKKIKEYLEKNRRITLAEARDLLQINRKSILLILEKLDENGITKRVGEYRELK